MRERRLTDSNLWEWRSHIDRCCGVCEKKHGNGTCKEQHKVIVLLVSLPRCCGASCAHVTRPSPPSCITAAGPTETESTQASRAEQTGQPISHSPNRVSGSRAFTGFVGRKMCVYVCTHNVWQRGGIQIQLRRKLFAWVTGLAADVFQSFFLAFSLRAY